MCPDITSRQHRMVGVFKSAARRESDLALLDGWHLLHEAVASHLELTTVAVSVTPPTDRDRSLLQRVSETCAVVTVTASVMNALSPARTPSGVVALARPCRVVIHDVLTAAHPLVLVAVDVQDPGNAGAIVRSAEAGSATGIVLTGTSADPWGWKALRAAMGSTFRVPVLRHSDAGTILVALRDAGLSLLATVADGGTPMHLTDLHRPLAFVLGGEGGGLDESILGHCDERVSIPMSGGVESLNVAVAAALLVYEARRQRQVGG